MAVFLFRGDFCAKRFKMYSSPSPRKIQHIYEEKSKFSTTFLKITIFLQQDDGCSSKNHKKRKRFFPNIPIKNPS